MAKDDKKKKIESLHISIANTESAIAVAETEGNKRAADSARRCLKGFQLVLEKLKAK